MAMYVRWAVTIWLTMGCSAVMDDVERLGERGVDSADTSNDSGETDSTIISDFCDDAAGFTCYLGDVWCVDSDSERLAQANSCDNGECEGGECVCVAGWDGDKCDHVTDCTGHPDFTFCRVETFTAAAGDLWYDVCIGGNCVSPGSCGAADCNGGGIYFELAHPGEESFVTLAVSDTEAAILDEHTQLTWMKCPLGQSGTMCDETNSAGGYSWTDALTTCNLLEYAGFDDWYLPSEFELLTLVAIDLEAVVQINSEVFPSTPALDFWTSTTYSLNEGYAKRVFFNSGLLRGDHPDGLNGNVGLKAELHPVRCVRREAVNTPVARWERQTDIGDGAQPVVTDALSDRMWMGCPAGQNGADCSVGGMLSMSLADAEAFCNTLDWADAADWRLATPLEYFSLVDAATVFSALGAREYWSVTNGSGYYVDTGLWIIGGRPATVTHPFVCIRDNR